MSEGRHKSKCLSSSSMCNLLTQLMSVHNHHPSYLSRWGGGLTGTQWRTYVMRKLRVVVFNVFMRKYVILITVLKNNEP